jgi:hypothetical protein
VAWRRRGRPKRAGAKRRQTTAVGRRPEPDQGSPELRIRKIRIANGSAAPVELVDIVGVLFANELIVEEELIQLRLLADWLRQLCVGLGLRQASPGGLWAAITSGAGIVGMISAAHGGDRALFRLVQLFDYFTAIDQLELLRFIIAVAANETHPENPHQLARLRHGVQMVMQRQRRGHPARSSAARRTSKR